MTGGIIPKGFNTIIPIESINFYPNKKSRKFIIIDKKIKKNDHVRFAGSDYKKGELIIKKNQPADRRSNKNKSPRSPLKARRKSNLEN